MAITELRYGGENSYPVEFVQELPKDKILIIMHKHKHIAYIITDIIKNISIPVAMLTPLCCIDQRVNRETSIPLMSLFDYYKVFSLSRLSDIQKINSYEFND
jgi:hypothetical protein